MSVHRYNQEAVKTATSDLRAAHARLHAALNKADEERLSEDLVRQFATSLGVLQLERPPVSRGDYTAYLMQVLDTYDDNVGFPWASKLGARIAEKVAS